MNVTGLRAGSVRSAVSGSSGALGNELPAKKAYKKSLPGLDESMYRLIDWNVETLLRLLKQVVAFRESTSSPRRARVSYKDSSDLECRETPLEEVREIIALPEFDGKAAMKQKDLEKVEIPEDVVQQLHLLVSKIAAMYNANPFHNCKWTTMHRPASLSGAVSLTELFLLPFFSSDHSFSCQPCRDEVRTML